MNLRCLFLPVTLVAAIAGGGEFLFAAAGSRWKVPPNPLHLDFTAHTPERHAVLAEEGQAWEITTELLVIKHAEVAVVADLPETGRFQVRQSNADAQVDVKDVRVEGKRGAARLVSRLPAMTEADALRRAREKIGKTWDPVFNPLLEQSRSLGKEQLRSYLREHNLPLPKALATEQEELQQAYAGDCAVKKLLPEVRQWLAELADRRPQWVTAKDKARWAKTENCSLLEDYLDLLAHEMIDEYLARCGVGCETNASNFRNRLGARLAAVQLIITGKASEGGTEPPGVLKALSPQDLKALSSALSVQLQCRFYPEVDVADPNAQWFQGPRVGCRAAGVASIRLEGKLAPTSHDRTDWWLIDGYDPGSVNMEVAKNAAFRVDAPIMSEYGAALRVSATGEQSTDYGVEFRPVGKTRSKLKVIVYESPSITGAKFPF